MKAGCLFITQEYPFIDALQNIVSFNIGDFEPTLSDHCPIFVKILSPFSEKQLPNL